MRKFLSIAAVVFALLVGLSAEVFSQTPQRQVAARQAPEQPRQLPRNDYRLPEDAKHLIRQNCPTILREAPNQKLGELMSLCPVRNVAAIPTTNLGPWRALVTALVRMFGQIQNLIYVAAVFLLLWILVEGAYRGEARWVNLWWLVGGLVGMAGANAFLHWTLGETTLADIRLGNMYVDCRRHTEPLYPCAPNNSDAMQIDARFVLMYQGTAKPARAGLW